MEPYAIYLHIELLDIVPTRGEQRRKVMDFIRSLANNPHTLGDFTNQDASLRIRQMKVIGQYAITYWADDPVKTVMVVEVRLADR